MSATETTLIQRAQKGDHDAFAELVTEHQRYVFILDDSQSKIENVTLMFGNQRRKGIMISPLRALDEDGFSS